MGLSAQAQNSMSSDKFEATWKKAQEHLEYDEYDQALKHLQRLNESDKNSPEIEYHLGICYLHSIHNEKALKHLQNAEEANFTLKEAGDDVTLEFDEEHNDYVSEDLDYNLGRAYQLHMEFDKAIAHYEAFRKKLSKTKHKHTKKEVKEQELKVISHFIETAQNGKELVVNPVEGVTIINMGSEINSEYEDIAPLITADENTMIFTSRRENTTGGKIHHDGKYMEDIYIAHKKSDGKWSKAQKISNKINTEDQDAAVAISPDGQSLLLYRNNHHGTGDLYYSSLERYGWTTPEKLEGGVNTRHWENSASISLDKKTIIFTSNRPGGKGGEDLYTAHRLENGTWSEAQILGDNINTEWDEDAPFLHPDGKHLYFSSKGHNSMGGYDIFRSEWDEEAKEWGKPKNMGYPINSPENDIFFVWSPDGTRAYFSSHHEDSYGDQDIYMMTLPSNAKEVILVKGTITDELTGKPLHAHIMIREEGSNEEVASAYSNPHSGEYTIVLPADKHYTIQVDKPAYFSQKNEFDLPHLNKYYEQEENFKLGRDVEKIVYELEQLFFENNQAELNEAAYLEIDRFVEMVKENPSLEIEIAGHTELGGVRETNVELSLRRSEAIRDYLLSQGIPKKSVRAFGYGDRFPKTKGTTESEKKMNRRTEIIIHDTEKEGKDWNPYYER